MVFGIVLAIAVAVIAALLLSLQTQYRADVANFFIKHAVDQPVVIEDVEYQAPYPSPMESPIPNQKSNQFCISIRSISGSAPTLSLKPNSS